jgi:hypothetical protein
MAAPLRNIERLDSVDSSLNLRSVGQVFPDPMSESMAESWRSGAVKALERRFAMFVAPEPVKA